MAYQRAKEEIVEACPQTTDAGNEELYLFPTYQQNYVWTKDKTEGSPTDESITFQTKEGLSINTDVGISLSVDPDHVSVLFQKFHNNSI